MREVELLIIGSGPAGLCAAVSAASSGAKVLVLERSFRPGGQLIKQTHMFFGSESQYASHRGVDIAEILLKKIEEFGDRIEIMLNATAVGFYEDNVVTVLKDEKEYGSSTGPRTRMTWTRGSSRRQATSSCSSSGTSPARRASRRYATTPR